MTTTTLSASGITKTLAMSNLTSNSMPAKVATIRSQYVKGNEPGTTGTGRQQSGNHISLLETVSTIGPNSLLGSNASALAAERLVSVPETFRFADIQLGECLSRGESTVVSKGRIISSGQEVVVKMAQTGSSDAESTTQDIISEIRLLSGLNHPRLVTLLGACFDPLHLALVTELIPGGNLYSALHVQRRCFLPSERFQLGCDLLEGAGYLHSQSPPVVHLDLKSMNLVLDASGQHLQICDFGLARTLSAAGGASGSSSSNGNGASNGNDDRPLNIDSSCSSSSGKRGNVCSIALHHNADEDEDLDLDLDLVVDVDTGLTSFARASPSAEKARGTNDNNNNSNGNNSNNTNRDNSIHGNTNTSNIRICKRNSSSSSTCCSRNLINSFKIMSINNQASKKFGRFRLIAGTNTSRSLHTKTKDDNDSTSTRTHLSAFKNNSPSNRSSSSSNSSSSNKSNRRNSGSTGKSSLGQLRQGAHHPLSSRPPRTVKASTLPC